jgi:tape measure domain-containing protein
MTTYNIEIVVNGRDRASGPLGAVGGALSRIGQIAGGILGAAMFMKIANGLYDMATAAVEATAQVQQMTVAVENLLARDLILAAGFDKNGEALAKFSDILPTVKEHARVVMDQLARLAIYSPYTYELVTNTFKQGMAFGFTADEAMNFTKGLLTTAAGIGATNDMLERMAYNFAQIRRQGKITALDVRQLAQAGFDLVGFLQYFGKQTGHTIKDIKDFNALLASGKVDWTQFTEIFAKYSDTVFGDAAKRMSMTLEGLKNTFSDAFKLTMPKILGPALEEVTKFLDDLLNRFVALRDSPVLDNLGVALQNSMRKFFGSDSMINAGETLFTNVTNGIVTLTDALNALNNDNLVQFFTVLGINQSVALRMTGLIYDVQRALAALSRGDLGSFAVHLGDMWKHLTEGFSDWASSIDWEKASKDIADGINSIDWAKAGLDFQLGISNLFAGFKTAIDKIAWGDVFGAIGHGFADFWAGFLGSDWDSIMAIWQSNINQLPGVLKNIRTPVATAGTAIGTAIRTGIISAIETVKASFVGGMTILVTELLTAKNRISGYIDGIKTKFTTAFNGIKSAIDKVKSTIQTLIDILSRLASALPGWATPGSPTPFEIGLRGINSAMQAVNRNFGVMDRQYTTSQVNNNSSWTNKGPINVIYQGGKDDLDSLLRKIQSRKGTA